jgi:NAD(P)H dehydrogenase (quinone)
MPPTIPSRKVLVLFYSFTGKTADLAREVAAGAAEVEGSDVRIMRVPELIPESVFEHKPELKEIRDRLVAEFPEATVGDMMNADAIAFGTPVHFGSFASQIKQFIDQLSPVWLKGDMVNKPAAVFCSAGTLHAGEETALISMIIPLLNLGMLPIGIPYPIQGEGPDFEGGSPYGAVYTSGHRGELPLGEADRKTARILGKRLANTARLLAYGNAFCEACTILRKEA